MQFNYNKQNLDFPIFTGTKTPVLIYFSYLLLETIRQTKKSDLIYYKIGRLVSPKLLEPMHYLYFFIFYLMFLGLFEWLTTTTNHVKNSMINILGGFTKEQVQQTVKEHVNEGVDQKVGHILDRVSEIDTLCDQALKTRVIDLKTNSLTEYCRQVVLSESLNERSRTKMLAIYHKESEYEAAYTLDNSQKVAEHLNMAKNKLEIPHESVSVIYNELLKQAQQSNVNPIALGKQYALGANTALNVDANGIKTVKYINVNTESLRSYWNYICSNAFEPRKEAQSHLTSLKNLSGKIKELKDDLNKDKFLGHQEYDNMLNLEDNISFLLPYKSNRIEDIIFGIDINNINLDKMFSFIENNFNHFSMFLEMPSSLPSLYLVLFVVYFIFFNVFILLTKLKKIELGFYLIKGSLSKILGIK